MNARAALVAVLLKHELRMLVRDRRTIILSVVLPLVLMPIILFGNRVVEQRRQQKLEETTYVYAVTGSQADDVRALISDALAAASPDSEKAPPKLQERQVEDPRAALDSEDLHFFLEGLSFDDYDAEEGEPEAELDVPAPVVRIAFRGDRDASETGARKARDLLREQRIRQRFALLVEQGFPLAQDEVVPVEPEDVASSAQVASSKLGKFVTALVVMFILMGGSVIATDSIAGEKERGTLETLLTTAAGRVEIVTAKQLAILGVALVVTIIQALNLLVYVGFGIIPVPESFSVQISPASALLLLVIFLPTASLISSVLLLISGRASGYKEAQLYFFPVFLVGLLLSVASVLPGIELRSAIAVVPIANTSVAVREVLVGIYDWPFLLVSWLATAGFAAWAARLTLTSLSNEQLIMSAAAEPGAETADQRFSRDVLRWFAVVWAVFLVVPTQIEALQSVTGQILFNLVFLFGGASLLMVKRYRLDPSQVFALRLPRAWVWPAVLVGVPAGFLTVMGVFRLANYVFPVSEKMMESFSEALLPEQLATWQLAILICVMPGIFEELFFRGALLHGLRRRLHPALLVLVVSLVFAFFHVSLFRIAPTAFLGILLATVTLLTGSIFPAMLWHALSNGISLAAARFNVPVGEIGPGIELAGAAVLAVVFWVLWRVRTPYPGLRPWQRG